MEESNVVVVGKEIINLDNINYIKIHDEGIELASYISISYTGASYEIHMYLRDPEVKEFLTWYKNRALKWFNAVSAPLTLPE